jgi:hypothetical protein
VTVTAPPPQDELELLIREARARQRRRWIGFAAALAAATGLGLGVNAIVSGADSARRSHGVPALAAAPRCESRQLRLSGGFAGAGTGNAWFDFAFRNVSASSCALRGWPTLRLRFASGRVLTVRARTRYVTGSGKVIPIRTVRLRAGGFASFALHVLGTHPGGRPCPQTGNVSAVPPGGREAVRARLTRAADTPAAVWACKGEAWVAPVASGATRKYSTQ